jgi:hypothetical protein
VFAAALAWPGVRLPADGPGLRRFRVPVEEGMAVSQTFFMPAADMQSIELFPAAGVGPVSGKVRFELYDVTDRVGRVHEKEVPAVDVMRGPTYDLTFPAMSQSDNHTFRLDVTVAADDPPTGVGLWATKGWRYPGGTLFINDRERWADLAFSTFAPAGRSAWRRLMDASSSGQRPYLASVVLGSLAVYWVILGFVVQRVSRARGAWS